MTGGNLKETPMTLTESVKDNIARQIETDKNNNYVIGLGYSQPLEGGL